MKAGRGKDDAGNRPRPRAKMLVTEPRLTVVEGSELADPAALDEAIGLLVTWAIRAYEAQQGRCPATDDSVTYDIDRACEGSN